MKKESVNFKAPLSQDNVFVKNEVVSLAKITGFPTRKGLENAILSEGQIVNVVSSGYGHLPNEKFFYQVESKLIDAGINYQIRSINRDNRSFVVDYILSDENFHINIKNGMDKIRPMLRFTNSYDGSCKTSGHFGFFREVCANGLHVAHSQIGFSVKHRGAICEIVLPEISQLVKKFMDNEYYSLHRKFEVLAERPIKDLKEFVKWTCEKTDLFQYQASEKNPDPSLNARMVIDIVNRESKILGTAPNMWLGYNAFNEVLHGKLKKTFEAQKKLDSKIFETLVGALS
jgi:hypothetical protein